MEDDGGQWENWAMQLQQLRELQEEAKEYEFYLGEKRYERQYIER